MRNKARISFVFVAEYPPRWRNIVEKEAEARHFDTEEVIPQKLREQVLYFYSTTATNRADRFLL